MLRNSLAHLIARIVVLAAGIVAIPLVTLTLGSEALGLVGVYATLQGMLALFDLGLPIAVNHRLAVMIGRGAAPAEQAVLVRTIEVLFWIFVALFFAVGFALHGLLADAWLNFAVLSRGTVEDALVLMIAAAAIRFPVAFYSNVLYARDRHIFPNIVTALSAIFRIFTSLVALVEFNVGIVGFFVIQLIGGAVEVILLIGGTWLRQPHRLVLPSWLVLYDIRAMAGGLTLVSLTAVALSQVDKIILSKLLSLGDFGLYSAGYTMAAGLVALSYPVGNAIFPRLSRSLDSKDGGAARIVQVATELTILILVPFGCVLIMQPEPLLRLLFLVRPIPETLLNILPFMMLGAIAQGFVTLPHLFQVAAGRVATVAWINGGLLVPYGIVVFIATSKAGVSGAVMAFAVFNLARLFLHWGILLNRRDANSTWHSSIMLTVASVVSGLLLAGAPRVIEISEFTGIVVAVLCVPALAVAAAAVLPHTRTRLFALRRTSRD